MFQARFGYLWMFLWMPAPCICHTCASVTNPLATLLVAEGVDGFDGVTLVRPKDRVQDIKQIVVELRENGTFNELL